VSAEEAEFYGVEVTVVKSISKGRASWRLRSAIRYSRLYVCVTAETSDDDLSAAAIAEARSPELTRILLERITLISETSVWLVKE
jgi:hypothetical protein